ncbi:MAG: 5-dehydro-4-deoxy-D-glucuronate isomerase [Gracilimonas sp.]|nr:5-dehydro-4-deoxy-D-glucuronate isomerase [Gracilimonas sp.]
MSVNYTVRYATNPEDVKSYGTDRLRDDFLIENLFEDGEINMVYSFYGRQIVGGAKPSSSPLKLETIDPLKANFFLERRELGVINVGEPGIVKVGDTEYEIDFKEAIYIGRGEEEVSFHQKDGKQPLFYFNSAPAHKAYPTKKVSQDQAEIVELGSLETANHRVIRKLIVNSIVDTCQLQMGMTQLETGSVWNTMPAHVHNRRMEAYFYFEVPEEQAVCHFMGEPDNTRHIWMENNQAVLSPPWSIHCGSGTSNYTFIWAMNGENLDYGDMDHVEIKDLR